MLEDELQLLRVQASQQEKTASQLRAQVAAHEATESQLRAQLHALQAAAPAMEAAAQAAAAEGAVQQAEVEALRAKLELTELAVTDLEKKLQAALEDLKNEQAENAKLQTSGQAKPSFLKQMRAHVLEEAREEARLHWEKANGAKEKEAAVVLLLAKAEWLNMEQELEVATREVARLVAALVSANEAALESAERAIHESGPAGEKPGDDPAAHRPTTPPAADGQGPSGTLDAMLQWKHEAVASTDVTRSTNKVLESHMGYSNSVMQDVPLSTIESRILNIQSSSPAGPASEEEDVGAGVICDAGVSSDVEGGGVKAPAIETASSEERPRPRSISARVRGLLGGERRRSRSRSLSPMRSRLSRGLSWRSRGLSAER